MSLARHVLVWMFVMAAGTALGAVGVTAWREGWTVPWNWTAVLALALAANAVAAVLPIWREERRRRRQAALLRFRLWIHFSKLHWLLTHLDEHDPERRFLTPGVGGEELFAIEVMLAQAQALEVDEYEWVIFTVNGVLPYFGRPVRELGPQATRLRWMVDATLARLNRAPSGEPLHVGTEP
jgi:hypothetical protein